MGDVVQLHCAQFSVGELVEHKMFGYRGVIVDVDRQFNLTDEWYDQVARSRPPKNKPWYHVLVHGATHATYVAERNLKKDTSEKPVRHPMIGYYFASFEDGHYLPKNKHN
jgi:heat shock protein HspQ